MYDVKDTFQMMVKARTAGAFKPEEEIPSKYTMLMSICMRNTTNSVVDFFDIFRNCHLTSNGIIDYDDAIKIMYVTDENGKKTSDSSVPRYGIFIRNNLPMWIVEIMLEVKMSFAYLFTDYDNVELGIVDTEDELNAWLELAKVNSATIADDFILTGMDSANLRASLRSFDETWTISEESENLIMKISEIDKDNIILTPQEHLARLLPYRYKISIDNFKKEIKDKHIRLYAVRIS